MTNAEKYKEVFGMNVDKSICPSSDCIDCPCARRNELGELSCYGASTYEWWNKDYKGVLNNG